MQQQASVGCPLVDHVAPLVMTYLVGNRHEHGVVAMTLGGLARTPLAQQHHAGLRIVARLEQIAVHINDGEYVGGFTRDDIDSLLETLESNYLGWSSTMAPAIMGSPGQPELGVELTNSFCRTDPDIAKHFARVTFLSDNRDDLPRLQTPTLILQCTDDMIAPTSVGDYMAKVLPNATLRLIDNTGHCPHLSAPSASAQAIRAFLTTQNL